MKIDGDKLINLMFLPITDNKIVELFDSWGMEQPKIDEKYEKDLNITLLDLNDTETSFVFEEINGYSVDGIPCLVKIDFSYDKEIRLPFNLDFDDDYSKCCEKIQKKADYFNKYISENKIWIIKIENDKKYSLSINFLDNTFKKIDSVIFSIFNDNRVGTYLLENKE